VSRRAAAAAVLAALLGSGAAPAQAPPTAASPDAEVVTPPEHRRGTEQTFLTFPEWFLVHSPAEYAAFVRDHPPSEFPFFGHIGQFWSSYRTVTAATREGYPLNAGYHVMIVVIGVSTTVEYALRSGYETLVGRVSELAARHGPTAEDRLGARVAQDYVDFIRVRPWYEYDFRGQLRRLWSQTGLWGPDPVRKWERKYALTSEYGVKALYGWLIWKATQAAYEDAKPVTAVWLDRVPEGLEGELPDLTVLRRFPDGSALVTVPRYEAFKRYSAVLAGHGASFREIAGNRTVILVSALVPATRTPAPGERVLFTQPLLTQPGRQRVALVVPVDGLARTLNDLAHGGGELEHVYDY
jgi:hypothetical protein